MRFQIMIVAVAGALAGCGGVTLSPTAFNNTMAEYNTQQDHKAIYINTDNYRTYYVWSRADGVSAMNDARDNCQSDSQTRGVNASACIPVAVDETQYWNANVQIQADQQREQQQQADLNNLTSQLNILSGELANLRH